MQKAEDHGKGSWCLLGIALFICFGAWHWAGSLLIPASTARALAGGRPIGNNSDLYPRWLGARATLLHHEDPYGPEVTRQIQSGFYGRPLNANKLSDPVDQQAFAYPLYVVFLVAPTITLPFPAVMKGFGWFLLFCTAASVPLWTHALGLRLPLVLLLAIAVLALSTYPVIQGFYKQQLTLLVAFLLAAAAAAVVKGRLAVSGFLLALSTIKPQISALLIFWYLIWAIGHWKNRKALVWSFAVTMTVLLAGAEILQPGWIPEFVAAIQAYRHYAADEPILQALLTPIAGEIAAAALIAGFIVFCWKWRKLAALSPEFGAPIVLATASTLCILNKVAPYNQVLLLPAVLWLMARWQTKEKFRFGAGPAMVGVAGCLAWQWIAAFLLAGWSLVAHLTQLRVIQVPFYTLFALPPIILLAVLLSLPASKIPLPSVNAIE